MRRKPPHSFAMRRSYGPQHRKVETQSASNGSPINSGISERLIEGAQVSPFFKPPNSNNAEALVHGDNDLSQQDMHLDAFDLELLAQSNRITNCPGAGTPVQRNTLEQTSNLFHGIQISDLDVVGGVMPTIAYKGRDSDHYITPNRLINSPSNVDLGSSSSPLTSSQMSRMSAPVRGAIDNSPLQNFSYQTQGDEISSSHSALEDSGLPTPSRKLPFRNLPMSVRGIVLISTHELPDNYRSLFHFPVFNAVQSKCFQSVYRSDDNIVLAAPTGSGKTAVMELAICRLLYNLKDERFKVIYQAPTKSLCSERFRDWNRKFQTLGLQCAELTGDTDQTQLKSVQNSQIIITTPEKWDSMTRKWKDHVRLMQLIKLFLIDEVHILNETRGATLEAVVSRMKSIGSNVRFVALSATIPNSEDIAAWLGRNATSQHLPALREHFGEEFRPVRLQRFVIGFPSLANDFAFDKMCTSKLSDVISKYGCGKPIMIFCCTRNSSVATAKELARLWSSSNPPARLWKGPSKPMSIDNADLRSTTMAGVAFHHAGLDPADRHAAENGFLQGQINIICCTSTLAVGVNLPCHLVIIKNTVGWQSGGCKEYSDLEIMQMLGRAGRPQFDDSAIAVILTRKERVDYYERLVSGSESLESFLHLNLIDHLNAEIGLGNVTDVDAAVRWLAGTFLFVRLRRNPTHYQLKEGADKDDENDMLRQICEKDVQLLQECGLVSAGRLKSTQFGDAMARYYVRFETMKRFLALKPQSALSQILSVICQADEFREIRLKAGEKSLYKEINRANGIRFPVKVDIALPSHKISLLLQSELGAVEFPDGERFQKHRFALQQDKNLAFSHVNRLIRCIIDCQICLEDSIAVRNALELARSLAAKVWDGSPLQMKQIEQIGVVAVRKLAAAGVTTIDELENKEAHEIDMILSKNPPFGMKLLGRLADFPKLRISLKILGKDSKPSQIVAVRFKAELAFMNEKCPTYFQRRPIYVCFLAETSDGRMIDFRRISGTKIQNGHEILLSTEIRNKDQHIICYGMCDDIAGTLRSAQAKPEFPASVPAIHSGQECRNTQRYAMNSARPRSNSSQGRSNMYPKKDLFDSDDLLFDEFLDIEESSNWANIDKTNEMNSKQAKKSMNMDASRVEKEVKPSAVEETETTRLDNGKWACNHKCKDKTACKHLCCREGLDKPPKSNKKVPVTGIKIQQGLNQLTLSASMSQKSLRGNKSCNVFEPGESLQSIQKSTDVDKEPRLHYGPGSQHACGKDSSDYGDDDFSDFLSPSELLRGTQVTPPNRNGVAHNGSSKSIDILDMDDDWISVDTPSPSLPTKKQELCIFGPAGADNHERLTPPVARPDIHMNKDRSVTVEMSCPVKSPAHGKKRNIPLAFSSGEKRRKCERKENFLPEDPQISDNMNMSESQGHEIQMFAPSTPGQIPEDWEDIDPLLLSELKDIVNFF